MLRVGLGYDLHRLAEGRDLWVGGVKLSPGFGAVAHSDGDALVHAVIDAILSPLGAGDIGALFPDSDPAYKGISSLELLRRVKEKTLGNIKIQNIDCVVILDRPKILPHISFIKKNIAQILSIREEQIGIKGKTTENTSPGLIEAYAVALLEIPE